MFGWCSGLFSWDGVVVVRLIVVRWCGLVAALVAALLVPGSPVGAVAGFGDVDGDRYFGGCGAVVG